MAKVTSTDFITIPTQDPDKSRDFYVNLLGFVPDKDRKYEVWAGNTCFNIWDPTTAGFPFAPQKNGSYALHVDDVPETRKELEAAGVTFQGDTIDTGVCHIALFTDPDGNDLMLHHNYK